MIGFSGLANAQILSTSESNTPIIGPNLKWNRPAPFEGDSVFVGAHFRITKEKSVRNTRSNGQQINAIIDGVELRSNAECEIKEGGAVTVLSVSGNKAKVVYTPAATPRSIDCPAGVELEIKVSELQTYNAKYLARYQEIEEIKNTVYRSALGQSIPEMDGMKLGDAFLPTAFRWHEVVAPVTNRDFNRRNVLLDFGDACEIEPHATLTIKGFSESTKKVLVEYKGKRDVGPTCPDTALFLFDQNDLAKFKRPTASASAKNKQTSTGNI